MRFCNKGTIRLTRPARRPFMNPRGGGNRAQRRPDGLNSIATREVTTMTRVHAGAKATAKPSARKRERVASHVPTNSREAARKATSPSQASMIGATITLTQFLAQAGALSVAERQTIVDQAEIMLSSLYLHLPLKRSIHPSHPLPRPQLPLL